MQLKHLLTGAALILASVVCVPGFAVASKSSMVVLYAFSGAEDGLYPNAGIIMDPEGNIYGATWGGGNQNCYMGCGTVFKLSPTGTFTVLHSFNGTDGDKSEAPLIVDKYGVLYGTTNEGGAYSYGTVFKLTPDGSETVLHSFRHDGSDGILPTGGLIMDKHGNLYGTSYSGGPYDSGTVFKISPHGRETVLHGFAGNDGNHPAAGLISDTDGNLYGTTAYGGTYSGCDIGCGTVFKLAPDGTETVLHSFNGSDGAGPEAELLVDKQGNFYGTTTYGGIGSCYMECGIIFKLAPDLTETVLHSFPAKRRDGENPLGGLIENHKGDLFGTTYDGGPYYGGVVFKLEPDGSEHILQPLSRGSGINPVGRLLMDRLGNLYGTAQQGGAGGAGTIFKIQKN